MSLVNSSSVKNLLRIIRLLIVIPLAIVFIVIIGTILLVLWEDEKEIKKLINQMKEFV
jgi:hypothetical protein